MEKINTPDLPQRQEFLTSDYVPMAYYLDEEYDRAMAIAVYADDAELAALREKHGLPPDAPEALVIEAEVPITVPPRRIEWQWRRGGYIARVVDRLPCGDDVTVALLGAGSDADQPGA